ncbi:MAG TPA: ABC transporter permease subunit [Tepidisphaeraceae bacterium]|nr:ABC transporter permease subunit [Tepidisphaeraceae bacterium]
MLILASWETAYRVIGWKLWVFPAPSHVVDSLLEMVGVHTAFGEPLHTGWPRPLPEDRAANAARPQVEPWYGTPLVKAISYSGIRLVAGFAISVALGGTIGLLMWRFDAVDKMLGPLFLGLQTLPSVCWVPLAVLCFGINEKGILFVLIMGSFSAIALVLRDGLQTIPPLYPRAGLMLGARGWKLYWYVLLPASLPALAGSLRTGFSFAWRSLMGAELIFMVEKWRGLGYLLQMGREFSDIARVVAVMIVMVVIGMLADRWVFAIVQRRVQARFGLGS